MLAALLIAVFPDGAALAQTINTYTTTTTGTISNTTPCSNPLVRTFSVGSSYLVSNVNLGVFATHSWRGDLQITLQSPSGTRVQLVDGDINSVNGDNFNVLLDDSGTQTVNTDGNTTNHSATPPPPYQHRFTPNSPLSAFNGQNAQGTWRLEICDRYPNADNGTFRRADLYLTRAPANSADLSLTKLVSNSSPASGSGITYTIAVTNSSGSPTTASSVVVTDLLPAGVAYTSHSGSGTYDQTTGLWQVGSVAPGQTRTLTISATVTATSGASITNSAEVTSSSVVDPDSTPGNGVTSEDDYAAVSITISGARVAGTPPVLSCPKGNLLFDWDGRSWTSGSLSQSYSLTGLGALDFSISNPATWMNGAPETNTTMTGGFASAGLSLYQAIDFNARSEVAQTRLVLEHAVEGAQFTVIDVDFYNNQFADRIEVWGEYKGAIVMPVLTNGIANYVIGNQAYGDALSSDTSANGNVIVTFSAPIDTIVLDYGNHSTAPANPGGQAITIHDITLCVPNASLSVTKVSSLVSDPVNGASDPFAIPGALVSYCILISNSGTAKSTDVVATDILPPALSIQVGSIRSGTSCTSTPYTEDDNASGSDESDPYGASISGNTITMLANEIGAAEAMAIKFNATVN